MVEAMAFAAAAQAVAVYAAIAVSPGPNTFAVATEAALRGLRATLPLCAGIGLGVAVTAAGACSTAGVIQGHPSLGAALRCISAVSLIVLAIRLTSAHPGRTRIIPVPAGAFGLGLLTSITNPVSWAYFVTACSGPAGAAPAVVAVGAAAVAVCNAVALGGVLSCDAPRRWAERHERRLRVGAGGLLGAYAGWSLAPILLG